jgi:transcriptional regulator with XRE-family HTH domain
VRGASSETPRGAEHTFGRRLKELRARAGLTQAQLAELSAVPLGTIRDYEQGNRDPLLSTAFKLARALKLSLDEFDPDAPSRRRQPVGKATPRGGRKKSAAARKDGGGRGRRR